MAAQLSMCHMMLMCRTAVRVSLRLCSRRFNFLTDAVCRRISALCLFLFYCFRTQSMANCELAIHTAQTQHTHRNACACKPLNWLHQFICISYFARRRATGAISCHALAVRRSSPLCTLIWNFNNAPNPTIFGSSLDKCKIYSSIRLTVSVLALLEPRSRACVLRSEMNWTCATMINNCLGGVSFNQSIRVCVCAHRSIELRNNIERQSLSIVAECHQRQGAAKFQ